MNHKKFFLKLLLSVLFFLTLHCGSTPVETTETITYNIGGTITGLSGTVILQNNEGDDLTITADGPFTFTTKLADSAAYAVTVLTQPTDQTCSISSGTGTVATADVSDVTIVCSSTTYTVGGTLTGLSGTVVLQNNSGDDLTLTSDEDFTFATAVADGADYEVTVSSQPSGQTCSASSNTGTVSGANVTTVSVVCSSNTYTVGGTVTGLSGTLVLQNNSGDNLSLTASGSFTFSTAVADGAGYTVTVLTQPSGLTCSASSNSGTISGAAVTSVVVTCSATTFTVGGTLSSLSGTLVLQNNSSNNLSLTSSGSFTFTTAVATGASYSVTVLTQPTQQICTVSSGSGTISSANVTTVTIACISIRRIFVTNTTYNGNLGGISGADSKCSSDTNNPGNGSTYHALLMDSQTNRYVCTNSGDCSTADACTSGVDWVLKASMEYIRTDGTVIGTTSSKCLFDVFSGSSLTNAIGASGSYWDGIYDKWVSPSHNTCNRWTSSTNSGDFDGNGRIGSVSATDSTAFYVSTSLPTCDTSKSLICVEQ